MSTTEQHESEKEHVIVPDLCWVSEQGSYGQDKVVLFSRHSLTPDQWETLYALGEASRWDYVRAVLNNDDLSEWE